MVHAFAALQLIVALVPASAARVVAVATVDGSIAGWGKRNLRFHVARRADSLVELAISTTATAAASTTVAAAATATTPTVTAATTAVTPAATVPAAATAATIAAAPATKVAAGAGSASTASTGILLGTTTTRTTGGFVGKTLLLIESLLTGSEHERRATIAAGDVAIIEIHERPLGGK